MIMIKKLLNFRNNWTNKDTKEEREEKRFEKNEKEDKIEEDIKVRIRKVSWVQYGGERFGRLADGQSLSSRFNWNKGCHIENLSKSNVTRRCKGRKMEKDGGRFARESRPPGPTLFSRIIADDKTGPSSRSGITIEVVSRSRSSKITASLLTADFPPPPLLLFFHPLPPSRIRAALRDFSRSKIYRSTVINPSVRTYLRASWKLVRAHFQGKRIFSIDRSIDSILRVSFLIFFRLLFSGDEEDYIVKKEEHREFLDNWRCWCYLFIFTCYLVEDIIDIFYRSIYYFSLSVYYLAEILEDIIKE